jgi:hypothetical protein
MSLNQVEIVELASAARTTTETGAQRNTSADHADFIEVLLDMTAFVTTASLTLSIDQWDTAKAGYVQMLASTALTANGQKRLTVGPTSPTAANATLTAIVPLLYRVVVTHGNANSHTYSVSINLRGATN